MSTARPGLISFKVGPNMSETMSSVFVFSSATTERFKMALDPFETAFLDVARDFFETFESPQSQCWMTAFWRAEQAFPPPFGATIAHAIVLVVSALGAERTRPFSYFRSDSPLADQSLTSEERYLVAALRSIRQGDRSGALSNALLVCEGGECNGFLAALERIGIVTGDIQTPSFQPS